MLFDLRGGRRRRTVQAVYLTLALLMGGGLVLFGIGGDVQGGLVDAFSENRGDGSDAIRDQVERAEERTTANPRDAAAWAALAQARYQLASAGDAIDQTSGEYTEEGRQGLRSAIQAWERHVSLAGERPDADVAAVVTNAYVGLDQPARAASAWSIVISSRDEPAAGEYARLAGLYYEAGDTRQGDLAADRAVDAAAEGEQRRTLRQSLEQAKAQALQQQVQGATGGAAAPAPAPPVTP